MRIKVKAEIILTIQESTDRTPEEIVLLVEQKLNEQGLIHLPDDTQEGDQPKVGVRVHTQKIFAVSA